jgi:hypothetical protein
MMPLTACFGVNVPTAPPSPPIPPPEADPWKGQVATGAGTLSRPILSKMALKTSRGTATSAI